MSQTIKDLEAWLPQRPPILMLDEIQDLEPGKQGTGIRHFRAEDTCFQGHFPGKPILPGVLAIEALAQTALVVLASAHPQNEKPGLGYLAKVQNAGFYVPILPDQTIAFQVELVKKVHRFFMVKGQARCEDQICVKAELTLAMEYG